MKTKLLFYFSKDIIVAPTASQNILFFSCSDRIPEVIMDLIFPQSETCIRPKDFKGKELTYEQVFTDVAKDHPYVIKFK